MITWLKDIKKDAEIYLNHGEDDSKILFKQKLESLGFQNVKIPEKLEISPLKMLHKEQFKNLSRVDLVNGITTFENCINEQITNTKIINEKRSLNKELEVKKINIKIDKSIIEDYEKDVL